MFTSIFNRIFQKILPCFNFCAISDFVGLLLLLFADTSCPIQYRSWKRFSFRQQTSDTRWRTDGPMSAWWEFYHILDQPTRTSGEHRISSSRKRFLAASMLQWSRRPWIAIFFLFDFGGKTPNALYITSTNSPCLLGYSLATYGAIQMCFVW